MAAAAAATPTATVKTEPKESKKMPPRELDGFKMKLTSELEETCSSFPFSKAFGKSATASTVKMEYQYQVCHIKGFVKWEVDGATGPTHAQISLRRQNLQSPDPFKKLIFVPLARFGTDASATPKKQDFDLTKKGDASNLFWKPGNKGENTFLSELYHGRAPHCFAAVRRLLLTPIILRRFPGAFLFPARTGWRQVQNQRIGDGRVRTKRGQK